MDISNPPQKSIPVIRLNLIPIDFSSAFEANETTWAPKLKVKNEKMKIHTHNYTDAVFIRDLTYNKILIIIRVYSSGKYENFLH